MKSFLALGLAICLATSCTNKQNMPQEGTLTLKVIETTDVHGCFLPYDYINNRPLKGTMGRVCTYVDSLRSTHGDNVILLDNGDILQGQPTNYYYNYIKKDVPNIASEILNYMRYDAVTPGNHDIETGHDVYDKWIKDLKCPVIAANIINTKTNKPYTTPYVLLERHGVKIAVLGMITPAIPSWLGEELWSGMRFESIYESSKLWVKHLKEEENANIIIGLFHCGWNGGIVTDDYIENEAERVAKEVDGFDIIMYGHDHSPKVENITNTKGNKVVCINAGSNARNVGEVTINLTFKDGQISDKQVSGTLIDITGLAVDEKFDEKFKSHGNDIKAYADKEICQITTTINSHDCFFGSSAFTDLIHNLQLSISNADISLCAPLSTHAVIDKGAITISDMFKLYKYENKLTVLNMTGREIRNHLEMSYAIWTNQMTDANDHIMLLSQDERQDTHRYGFKNPTYNFDSAAGIDYEVDVTKPQGEKVNILRMTNGAEFDENQIYKVVTNSYRANGGGELIPVGAGIPKDSLKGRTVYQSEMDMRYCLMEEMKKIGTINPKPNNNWNFVPVKWVENAIKRDRKQLFNE